MQCRIGYVILHFMEVETTIKCVESVKRIIHSDDKIIVVDNGSSNCTGVILEERYCNDNEVDVILIEENLGFAKGNNVGYKLLKYKYRCNIIILLNNDILIQQKNFRDVLVSEYLERKFDICGPKILRANGEINICSPVRPTHSTLTRARMGQVINYIKYVLNFVNLDECVEKLFSHGNKKKSLLSSEKYQEDVQIHGCFIIFTQNYIDKYDGLNSNTFLYLEEQLLYVRAKKGLLSIVYDPELEVVHLEDVATNSVISTSKAKRHFLYKCQINSFRALIDELR